MEKIKKPAPINTDNYLLSNTEPKVFYGLPKEVIYCKRCVISNQRPNSVSEFKNVPDAKKLTIAFDADGICDACRVAEQKNSEIDWSERERELAELCNTFRRSDGSYDCIVPGSGGKDSFFASHILKNKYGMHPLTVTWAPHIYTKWGWNNFQSWIHAGHDNILTTPNGKIHRILTRISTELLLHPFQPFIMGQKALAPKMAALYNIPLVFYGENEAEYGNPKTDSLKSKRNQNLFSRENIEDLYLGGISITDLINNFGMEKNDFVPYLPSDKDDLNKKKINVHYLGYYLKWHPQSCYYYAVENGGFEPSPERTAGTYSKYNGIDDKIDDLHYFTTGIKFGIGRASYDAAQEIRSGDITRDEGVALIRRYDHEFPQRFINELLTYLSLPLDDFPEAGSMFEQPVIDSEYFKLLVDKFRSPHIWYLDINEWKLRNPIWK